MRSLHSQRGVSLVDVVVGSALFLIIFVGLFGILRASVAISGLTKLKAAATAIATSQIEYLRSLDYDAVGTLGGIPAGTIAQQTTTTQAGLDFSVRTYVVYADDAADGVGSLDTNGITTDYKRAKVTVSYEVEGVERAVTLVTNIVPRGIESTNGGGTLKINVFDAQGAALSGATVHIVNDTLAPTVDFSTFSDATGVVFLPGAPTSTDYQVYVTKDGYSSAQTYERDATNVNPTPGYLTVAEAQTTTGTFSIDGLATLTIRTFSPSAGSSFLDSFADASQLAASSSVAVSSGALMLEGAVGTYVSSGNARSVVVAPSTLTSWDTLTPTLDTPVGTSVVVHIVDGAGSLVPDADLVGNSIGFTGVVNLSGLSTTTYPSLALQANLQSSDVNVTPAVLAWDLAYTGGPLPLANVPFTITGGKTIGSQSDGSAILKTTVATTTDSSGVRTLYVEWDSYDLSVTGYTLQSTDPILPYEVLPNTTVDASLILIP